MIHVNPDWRVKISHPDLVPWVNSLPEATFYDLWESNINPDWVFHLAINGGATKQQLVFANCGVARLCLYAVPEGENRPRVAIETAEAWARGETTDEDLRKARVAAAFSIFNISEESDAAAFAAYNSAYLVFTTLPFPTYSSKYALQMGIENQVICATIRKHLPFERPPPPPKRLTIWQRLAEGGDE